MKFLKNFTFLKLTETFTQRAVTLSIYKSYLPFLKLITDYIFKTRFFHNKICYMHNILRKCYGMQIFAFIKKNKKHANIDFNKLLQMTDRFQCQQ